MRDHKLIFSGLFKDEGLIVNYLDIGARGDITSPWSLFDEGALRVIGFEPDPSECHRLSQAFPSRVYYPHALWSRHENRTFYLCDWESTSSMYPPNQEANRAFLPRHWTGRKPKDEILVPCVALDDVLASQDLPDFIKVDTQGSEYEILCGAERVLTESHPLVLAETWCAEVYQGAPLTHDVMRLMHERGYTVFDLNVAAAWKYGGMKMEALNCKSRMIGFDLLFIKRLDLVSFQDIKPLIKFVALCELFGFRDYALMCLERSPYSADPLAQLAKAQMLANDQWEKAWGRRFTNQIRRLFGRSRLLWPDLH